MILVVETESRQTIILLVIFLYLSSIDGGDDVISCDSFPVAAICGNSSHRVTLSIDICHQYTSSIKCKSCVAAEKLREVIEIFEACKNATEFIHATKESNEILKILTKSRKRWKRQTRRRMSRRSSCRNLEPPKPGKMSCKIYPGSMTCVGTCNVGYRFQGNSEQIEISCSENEGLWKPHATFLPCEPQCDPPCQNGGSCLEVNECFCTNEFRGALCEYPISLCGIEKTRQASSWNCNHTKTETRCSVSCNPPGSYEASRDARLHTCSYIGEWTPVLPSCVKKGGLSGIVVWCPKLGSLENGRSNVDGDSVMLPGTKVTYSCYRGFTLNGESEIHCQADGTWNGEKPECVETIPSGSCLDPGDVENAWKEAAPGPFYIGSVVSYSCYENFKLMGEPDLICIANRRWSAVKPVCTKKNVHQPGTAAHCFYTEAPLNTEVKLHIPPNSDSSWTMVSTGFVKRDGNKPDTFPVGSKIQYRCISQYYKLHGSEYQTCQDSGTWSGNKPTCVPECGKSDAPRTPFIVHGNSTSVGQWPWQVAIFVQASRDKGHLTCGGSLLNENWVVTAAHCLTNPNSNSKLDSSSITIYAGKYYRSFDWDDEHVQKKAVRRLVVHEEYDFVKFDYDIALIQLASSVTLTGRVQPICLPTESTTRVNMKDGELGVVIGWGLTESGRYSEVLRESILPVVSHTDCENGYRMGKYRLTVTENMFCAGYEKGQIDTCVGDSGGPMMFLDETQRPNKWILEGIVSWGSEGGCGQENRYGGFTKVKMFTDWIKMMI